MSDPPEGRVLRSSTLSGGRRRRSRVAARIISPQGVGAAGRGPRRRDHQVGGGARRARAP